MNDAMIKRLAENDGVIMINYGSAFLTEKANQYGPKRDSAWEIYQSGIHNPNEDSMPKNRNEFEKNYALENPYPYATLNETLDHFDHVIKITGSVNHVGIGSDYDGVGDTLPEGLKDVSTYPALIKGFLDRGYSEEDIKKILSENLLRVWRDVEAVARNSN